MTSRQVASPRVVCVEDLRPMARRRVPRAVFDYLDGGAEGEVTLRENCRAFEDLTFRPRHAVALAECDLRTRALGLDLSLPVMLAPVGYSRLMHPGGEVAAARAAGRAGTAYILSTVSGHKLEDVKAASSGPVMLPALPHGRPGRGRGGHRARPCGRVRRAGRHHRHGRGRDPRTRSSQRDEGAGRSRACWRKSRSSPRSCRIRAGWWASCATAGSGRFRTS